MRRAPARRRRERGQAITEYVLVTTFMVLVVFMFSTDGLPFFPAIVDLFQIYIDSLYMVVTLPIP